MILGASACQTGPTAGQKPAPSAITFLGADTAGGRAGAKYSRLAEKAARGYVKLTLLAPGNADTGAPGGDLHTGSGIVIDRRGHILTAAHIARGLKYRLRVELRSGRRFVARVLRIDPKRELALLKAPPLPDVSPLTMAPPRTLKKGDLALAMGSPKRTWGVATVGQVRSPDIRERLDYGAWGFANAIEIGMHVQSGHSGGPVVDRRGRLVGMVASYELGDTTKWPYRSPGITYVVPVRQIRRWLKGGN